MWKKRFEREQKKLQGNETDKKHYAMKNLKMLQNEKKCRKCTKKNIEKGKKITEKAKQQQIWNKQKNRRKNQQKRKTPVKREKKTIRKIQNLNEKH